MQIHTMAWRNVLRNGRRSGVTIAAMALALFVMVLYSGLLTGYIQTMERDVLDLEVGDIQIYQKGYLDSPSVFTSIKNSGALLSALEEKGLNASARLKCGGLVAGNDSSAGASITGVTVDKDQTVSAIHSRIAQGKWLSSEHPTEAVIGRRLARILGVSIGDELVLLGQALDGSTANDLFTVRGILGPVSDGTDRGGIFLTESAFRDFIAMPTGAHVIIVRRSDMPLSEAAAIARGLPGDNIDVFTWRELMPTIATMLDSSRQIIYVVFFVVYIAVGILILNAMLMAVFERIREFGVLKAIGVGPGEVFGLIMIESFIQIGFAILIGGLLALPGMYYLTVHGIDVGVLAGTSMMGLSMPSIWYGIYDPETVAGPILMLTFMASIAALYPALKAAFIQPIDAMRHQ